MSMQIFDKAFSDLEGALATAVQRQAVIAQNIANADNIDYVPYDFDEVLQKAVKRREGDRVNIEQEMSALADNSLKYSAYTKLMTSKIGAMRSIITQGRK